MSRNGTGTYSLPVNSWYPPVNGVSATAADFNTLITDVANALTQSTSADGQTPIAGVWNFGANRISNVGAATNAGDAVSFGQSAVSFDSLTVTTTFSVPTITVSTINGSANLTGTPTAPTAAPGTNSTQIATTAFATALAFAAALPAQTNANGLSITSDGSTASWGLSTADKFTYMTAGII